MEANNNYIEVSQNGRATIVRVLEKEMLDPIVITNVTNTLLGIVEENSPLIQLVIDFECTNYLSSSALGMLIKINKRVCQDEGQLKLCRMKPKLYEVFEICKLDKLFKNYDTVEAACKDF